MRVTCLILLFTANSLLTPCAYAQLGGLFDQFKSGGAGAALTSEIYAIEQLRSEGKLEEAIRLAEQLVADAHKGGGFALLRPNANTSSGQAKMLLANLYGEAGNVERAIPIFEEGLKEAEESSPFRIAEERQPHIMRMNMVNKWLELVDLNIQAKRLDVAEKLVLDLAKKADAVGEDAELEQLTLYDKLGGIALQAKNFAKAESYLQTALQLANTMIAKSIDDKPGQGISGLAAATNIFSGVIGQVREMLPALQQNLLMQGLPNAPAGSRLLATKDAIEAGESSPHLATINKLAAVYGLTGKRGQLKQLYETDFEAYLAFQKRANAQIAGMSENGSTTLVFGQYGIEKSEFAFAQRFSSVGLLDEAEGAFITALRLNDERLREWYSSSQMTKLSSGSHEVRRKYAHAWLSMALAHPSRNHARLIEALGSAKGMTADYARAQNRSMAKLPPKMREALSSPVDNIAATMQYIYAAPDQREMQRRMDEFNNRRPPQTDARLRDEGKKTFRSLILAEFEADSLVYGAVTESKIRERLPKGAAYIEFVKVLITDDVGGRQDSFRYALVALLPNKNKVEVRDLGPASEIEVMIGRYGMEMNAFQMTKRLPDIERVKRIGKEIYARLLAPVVKAGQPYPILVICPDGELNLLPFEALVDDAGGFLISKTDVRYVASSRELLNRRPLAKAELTAAVFADPDYDYTAERSSAIPTDTAYAKRALMRSATGRALRDSTFDALPDTRKEAQNVEAAIKKSFGGKTTVLLGRDANTQNFLGIASPRFLHVATHGFFLEVPSTLLAKNGAAELRLATNPDEFSGLVLAGANKGIKAGNEDGIVLANRLSAMNLSGTELVVLSACSTGFGVASTGEGVYGLKRAIQIAGARSSITSLWNVASDETGTLMANFYERLATDNGTATALRNAKLSLMKTKPNPFFWAPFVLSGASAAQ